MAQDRPPIPAEIKRTVRQRGGFGCVVCGVPLYAYEHMEGYANVERHVAEEITLLCDRHHREKTGGLLPIEDVRAADAAPLNRQKGVSAPYSLHYSGDRCQANIGSNAMTAAAVGSFPAVMMDDLVVVGFRFEDGHYLLHVNLFDDNNERVLAIADNELVYSVDPWDVELVGTRLVIRVASRDILVDIRFDPPDRISFTRGRMLYSGIELLIRPEYVLVVNTGNVMSRCTVVGCNAGLVLGRNERPVGQIGFRMGKIPRYRIDREAAIKRARERITEKFGEASAADVS